MPYAKQSLNNTALPDRTARTLASLLVLSLLVSPHTLLAQNMQLRAYAGLFDTYAWFNGGDDTNTTEFGIELQGKPITQWQLTPLIGTAANRDNAALLYSGLQFNEWLGGGWVAGLGFAAAAYREGSSKELGSALEFRSSVEIARTFLGGHALGAQLYHISNAGIADSNPGNNSLVLFYSVPMRF